MENWLDEISYSASSWPLCTCSSAGCAHVVFVFEFLQEEMGVLSGMVFSCYIKRARRHRAEGSSWFVNSQPNRRKKDGTYKEDGRTGVLVRQKAGACVRNSWFLVTVEPASVWPLPLWRQRWGNTADGWLAGASASLWYTAGRLAPFVSIRRRRMGAGEALLYVFILFATSTTLVFLFLFFL